MIFFDAFKMWYNARNIKLFKTCIEKTTLKTETLKLTYIHKCILKRKFMSDGSHRMGLRKMSF